MFIHQEQLRVLRGFIAAQATICCTLLLIFLLAKKWELLVAVLLAVFLQLLQMYFWAKPSRVSHNKQWVSGVMRIVAFKHIVFAGSLIILLQIMPTLSNAKVFMAFASVFFVAYALPFWYCGIRQARFTSDVQVQHSLTVNQQLIEKVE